MTIYQIITLLLLGAGAGFLAGLLGIGGGMIMTPILTVLFSQLMFPEEHIVHLAIATSMTTIVFTTISSIFAHNRQKKIRWDIALGLGPGILLGGLIGGGKIFGILPTSWLALFFALFVGYSAIKMLKNSQPKLSRVLPNKIGLFGMGALIGSVSSLVGAAGGFISVPFMTRCNVPTHNAIATSAVLGFPIAFASAVGYLIGGYGITNLPPHTVGFIYLPALIAISCTSVITAPIGAKVAHRLDVSKLRRIFGIQLFFIAGYMLWKSYNAFLL